MLIVLLINELDFCFIVSDSLDCYTPASVDNGDDDDGDDGDDDDDDDDDDNDDNDNDNDDDNDDNDDDHDGKTLTCPGKFWLRVKNTFFQV